LVFTLSKSEHFYGTDPQTDTTTDAVPQNTTHHSLVIKVE